MVEMSSSEPAKKNRKRPNKVVQSVRVDRIESITRAQYKLMIAAGEVARWAREVTLLVDAAIGDDDVPDVEQGD